MFPALPIIKCLILCEANMSCSQPCLIEVLLCHLCGEWYYCSHSLYMIAERLQAVLVPPSALKPIALHILLRCYHESHLLQMMPLKWRTCVLQVATAFVRRFRRQQRCIGVGGYWRASPAPNRFRQTRRSNYAPQIVQCTAHLSMPRSDSVDLFLEIRLSVILVRPGLPDSKAEREVLTSTA